MVVLVQAFQKPAGELGTIHTREVENFLPQALVGLSGDCQERNVDEASDSFQRFCGVPSGHCPGTHVDPSDDERGQCGVDPPESLVF